MVAEVEFKFNIGDVVTHKTMAPPYLPKPEEGKEKLGDAQPQFFTIMGQMADWCPGGVQKHYRVRITDRVTWNRSIGVVDKLFQFHEEELVPLP